MGKKKEKDGFGLTQENKQNLFWGKIKNIIFSSSTPPEKMENGGGAQK